MTTLPAPTRTALLRRGFALEYTTLDWNVVGIIVLAIAALSPRSVALAGVGGEGSHGAARPGTDTDPGSRRLRRRSL